MAAIPNYEDTGDTVVDIDRERPTRTKPRSIDLLAGIRNGDWLDSQEFPDVEFHIPEVIPEGLTLLVAPPKAGKSWLALQFALELAVGGHVLGNVQVVQRPTLYLALEDSDRRMKSRCRKLLGTIRRTPGAFNFITQVSPDHALPTIEAFLDAHANEAPLVVLDTLGKVMPASLPGESAYQRDYRVAGSLKALADDCPGAAVVVVHHDRKAASEDFVDAVSGTHGLAGAADTIVVLARKRHETTALLKVTGRDIEERELAVEFTDGCYWRLSGTSIADSAARAEQARQVDGLGDRSAEIVAYVTSRMPDGASAGELDNRFGEGASRSAARLVERGTLAKPKRGIYVIP